MKLAGLVVGRSTPGWANDGAGAYAKRLRRYGGVEEVHVRQGIFRGDVDAVRTLEGERLLKRVSERDRLIALDERGRDVDTEAFTGVLRGARMAGAGRLVFAIGGAYGLSEQVRRRAWRVVRLSSLVLAHDVARVVLYEQLYRATTQLEGIPYHH